LRTTCVAAIVMIAIALQPLGWAACERQCTAAPMKAIASTGVDHCERAAQAGAGSLKGRTDAPHNRTGCTHRRVALGIASSPPSTPASAGHEWTAPAELALAVTVRSAILFIPPRPASSPPGILRLVVPLRI
jgi:hypothetical protein